MIRSLRGSPTSMLQWVHGCITVVMVDSIAPLVLGFALLQWVHGCITVVMNQGVENPSGALPASMGPRLHNRGYGPSQDSIRRQRTQLQWVHGCITVVMQGF